MGPQADFVEVFHSWQGEGLLVGCRQLFVRFAGCNLRCRYCDTRAAYAPADTFPFETADGSRTEVRNPVTADALAQLVRERAEPARVCPWVSVTGGEPLLADRFLKAFLPQLTSDGRRVMLETNGTLCDALAGVIQAVDCVAMDIKIPSTSGVPIDPQETRSFLEIAHTRDVFVKVVVNPLTTEKEIARLAGLVASVDATIPTVLQPETRPTGGLALHPASLRRIVLQLSRQLDDVRVIGQVHKLLGQP